RRRKHPARPALTATPDSTVDADLQGSGVWVFEAKSGDGHQVSPEGATAWGNEWSPDGNRLAFFCDSGHRMAVWTWSESAGAASVVTRVRAGVFSLPLWTRDGNHILVTLWPTDTGGANRSGSPVGALAEVPGLRVYRTGLSNDSSEGTPTPLW